MKAIKNVIGYNTDTPPGIRRLIEALLPYQDYPECQDEIRRLKNSTREIK